MAFYEREGRGYVRFIPVLDRRVRYVPIVRCYAICERRAKGRTWLREGSGGSDRS